MANIKTGAKVQNKGDLQNLITSVILRQTSTFSSNEIYEKVRENLKGSQYYNNSDLMKHCEDTIEKMFICDFLKRKANGIYILSMSFPALNYRKLHKNDSKNK